MSDLNKGEIGQPLVINFGEDISAATASTIELEPEIGSKKEFTATIPAVDFIVDGVTLALADEYVLYTTITKDDLDYVGRNRYRAGLTFSSTDKRKSNYVKFRVLP